MSRWLFLSACSLLIGSMWCGVEVAGQVVEKEGANATVEGQEAVVEKGEGEVVKKVQRASIDIEHWLRENELLQISMSGGAWIYHADPKRGKKMFRIPLKLHEVSEELTFEASDLKLMGGRFIGFVLDYKQPDEIAKDLGFKDRRIKLPRFCTKLTLLPGQKVKWYFPKKLQNSMLITPTQGYGLVVKPTSLPRPRPPKPIKMVRGQSITKYREDVQAQRLEYQKRLEE